MRPGAARAGAAWLLVAACGAPPPGEPPAAPADPEVLAVWANGSVTRQELDRAILSLPPGRRVPPVEGTESWYRGLLREVLVDRILVDEARSAGTADDPEFRAFHDHTRRQIVADLYLERLLEPPEPVSEEELRRLYEERRGEYDRAERRLLRHLFRRAGTPEERDRLRPELEALRERIFGGESFEGAARASSESETRIQGGSLGWVERDDLPEELAALVFSLPRGEPSRPVPTTEGLHLFLVEDVRAARRFSYDEVRERLRQELEARRRQEAVEAAVAGLPDPPGGFVVSKEELDLLLRSGDPSVPVLRSGDFTLSLGELGMALAEVRSRPGSGGPVAAHDLLAAFQRRERAYAAALAAGLAGESEVESRLATARERDLVRFLRSRRLFRWVDRDQEALREFHRRNRNRFTSPLRLELLRLRVPLESPRRAGLAMARMEEARAGTWDAAALETLAGGLGGVVENLGSVTVAELAREHRRLLDFALDLRPGELSIPFRHGDRLEALLALDRREPEPLPYAAVLDQVRAAYLARHGQEVYTAWVDDLLHRHEARILTDRLTGPIVSRLQG